MECFLQLPQKTYFISDMEVDAILSTTKKNINTRAGELYANQRVIY